MAAVAEFEPLTLGASAAVGGGGGDGAGAGPGGRDADGRGIGDKGDTGFAGSVFNAAAAMLGVVMLSVPYTVRLGGWTMVGFYVAAAAAMNYTGQVLVRMQLARPDLVSYPDIAASAFGRMGRYTLASVQALELFFLCVIFLILEGVVPRLGVGCVCHTGIREIIFVFVVYLNVPW